MKYIKLSLVSIICLLIICSCCLYSKFFLNKYICKEEYNKDFTEEILFIQNIDKYILEISPVEERSNGRFSNDYLVNIALIYVTQNVEKYNDKIIFLNTYYQFEYGGDSYHVNEYIDKKYIIEIINNLFAQEIFNVEDSIFYDKEKDLVAVLPIRGEKSLEISHYESVKIKNKEYGIEATLKYVRTSEVFENEFKVQYILEEKINQFNKKKYRLVSYRIYDSKINNIE